MRSWFNLCLCLCLLLSMPVRGDCCLGMVASGTAAAVAAPEADESLPPCHRAAPAAPQTRGDAPAQSDRDGCDHCQCPCRIAAMPLMQSLPGERPAVDFPPVQVSADFAERTRIPPLPPPIA